MSSSAPIKNDREDNDWNLVSKGGKVVRSPAGDPSQSVSSPAGTMKVNWASLFETPRSSPLSRPKSPEQAHCEALNVVAAVDPIVISWKHLQAPCRVKTRGMHNNGNMCFLNSILQSLIHCAPLANLFRLVPLRLLESLDTPFLLAFADLAVQFYEHVNNKQSSNEALVPEKLLDLLRTSAITSSFRGEQEDAQEFLTFLLDQMHEEFAKNKDSMNWEFSESTSNLFRSESMQEEQGWMEIGRRQKVSETRRMAKTETPISFLFAGQFRSTVRRTRTKDSITFEPFNCIPLEVHHRHIGSLEESLIFLSRPETIDVGLTKYISIGRLPMILIVQLKRFVYNKDSGRIEKVGKFISYPEKLLIPPQCHPGDARPAYRLFSVVYHHGRSAEGGHYTADVRKSFIHDDKWERVNDANIMTVTLEQVLAERRDNASAYLLFYQRIKDAKHSL